MKTQAVVVLLLTMLGHVPGCGGAATGSIRPGDQVVQEPVAELDREVPVDAEELQEVIGQLRKRVAAGPRGGIVLRQEPGQVIINRAFFPANNVLLDDLGVPVENESGPQDEFALGATLKTDPELESILEKADRYQADGNWDVACQLWQAVLERSSDTLVSPDGRHYRSMAEQVEKTLASLPPDGLAVYRIAADAAAREILARGDGPWDTEALALVSQRYFPSSVGDDAAFRLACLLIDQYEFVGAQRLLEKVLALHPDPDVDRAETIARLALCHAWNGDFEAAEALVPPGDPVAATLAGRAVRELVKSSSGDGGRALRIMAGSSFDGFRVQPAPPPDLLERPLVASWQFGIDPESSYNRSDMAGRTISAEAGAAEDFAMENLNSTEKSFQGEWTRNAWRPASRLALSGDRVLFKSAANLAAWKTGPEPELVWRSAWLNRFQLDDATAALESMRRQWANNQLPGQKRGQRRMPDNETTIQLFGDSIHASLRVAGDRVYSIEGASHDGQDGPRNPQRGVNWNVRTPRGRINYLAAYDAASGMAIWKVPRETQKKRAQRAPAADAADAPAADGGAVAAAGAESPLTLEGAGFMGPPEVVGQRLYVPVTVSGSIHVCCLDAADGRVVWRTFLCDEPETGAPPWAPITITSDGTDLFVGSGMGAVFCLERATGAVRFAQRYRRSGTPNMALRQFGMQLNTLDFDGWNEDLIIPWGREIICLASDAANLMSVDRTSGDVVWEAEMAPLGSRIDYVLGIHDRVLYTAGRETIVAFDLDGHGRMLWGGEALFGGGNSAGFGILTPAGIYVPVENSVWKFDLQPAQSMPEPVARATVKLGFEAPLGNLACDGKNIWVHAGNRMARLEPEGGAAADALSRNAPAPATLQYAETSVDPAR